MKYQEIYRALNEGMKKEALYGKGMLKAAIKQLFSSLRTPRGRSSFLSGFDRLQSIYPVTRTDPALKRLGRNLLNKAYFSDINKSPAIINELKNIRSTLADIPKNWFTGNISEKNADIAADQVWRRIRNSYLPTTFNRKTPLDKWY